MKDIFYQPRRVYRYTAIKGLHNSLPAIAVIATILWGATAGITVLALQFMTGAITDLSFFSALNEPKRED